MPIEFAEDDLIGAVRLAIAELIEWLDREPQAVETYATLLLDVQGRSGEVMEPGLLDDVQLLRSTLIRHLAPIIEREQEVEGIGHLSLHGGGPKSKRYDNDRVVGVVASRLADTEFVHVDKTTGEVIPRPPGVVAHDIVTIVADLVGARTASFSSWRKGVAESLGIHLDRFVIDNEGVAPWSITIR